MKGDRKLIEIRIPGWGDIDIENIIFDLNGTIATDGKIPDKVKEKIKILSEKVNVFVLTADTQGTADEQVQDMNVELIKIPVEDSKLGKLDFLKTLELNTTVVVGNGSNDQLILKEAVLGIVVLGEEGISASVLKNADIIVKNIVDAFDLFLKPKRLIATLKE
jgi:soluble P-type ATPase